MSPLKLYFRAMPIGVLEMVAIGIVGIVSF